MTLIPTCEQLWNEELEEIQEKVVDKWRHGVVVETIYKREEDATFWMASYRRSTDGETNELREGDAEICQVEPRQVTVTKYVPITKLSPVSTGQENDDGRS